MDATTKLMMELALQHAAEAWGETSPNPMVGAVVARGERVLGEAAHRRAGLPHAEPSALEAARLDPDFTVDSGDPLTLYVSLEPCVHEGRTPPCVDAILASPVRRVVVAHLDPDRRVAGRGVERLRAAGLSVAVGCMADEAAELNHIFIGRQRRGRAFVALKVALSADGCIAAADGRPAVISGDAARRHAHWLRAGHDGVVVGVETLARDRPRLDRRLYDGPGRSPRRLVIDPTLRADPAWLWPGETPAPVVFCSQAAVAARGARFAAATELVPLPEAAGGGLDLAALVDELPGRGVWSLLVEGGGRTHERFLAAGLWDRMWMYRNPRLRLAGLRWAAARVWSAIDLAPHQRSELRTDLLDVYAHPAALLAP